MASVANCPQASVRPTATSVAAAGSISPRSADVGTKTAAAQIPVSEGWAAATTTQVAPAIATAHPSQVQAVRRTTACAAAVASAR